MEVPTIDQFIEQFNKLSNETQIDSEEQWLALYQMYLNSVNLFYTLKRTDEIDAMQKEMNERFAGSDSTSLKLV